MAVNSVVVSVTSGGNPMKKVGSVSACTMRQRPNDGDHTQHPSGRLSETHSDNCIQLTQFPKERNGSTVR